MLGNRSCEGELCVMVNIEDNLSLKHSRGTDQPAMKSGHTIYQMCFPRTDITENFLALKSVQDVKPRPQSASLFRHDVYLILFPTEYTSLLH